MKGKTDFNHMFPFMIDNMIKNFKCVIKTKISKTHHYKGEMTMLYFPGKIIHNDGKVINGNFEYFISQRGILFHRLFKPCY